MILLNELVEVEKTMKSDISLYIFMRALWINSKAYEF